MRLNVLKVLGGLALLATSVAAHADVVTFTAIPNAKSANDMSPDGTFIVGSTLASEPYLYNTVTGNMTILPTLGSPFLEVVAVSDDGQVAVGTMIDGAGDEVAARWTASSGVWTSLGYLPNAGQCPSRSNGYEVSADGSVVVGLSWDGCSGRGFRWTQATGMVELQSLANGSNRASVLSADGSVIGGFAQGNFSRSPAVWTAAATGQLVENADTLGEVHGMNDAGTILLAERNGRATMVNYPSLTLNGIGMGSALPGWSGTPMDIADNGMVVGFDFLLGNRRAWIHPAGAGPMVDLTTYIQSNGGTVPGGQTLEVCQAISTDGTLIIGHGFGTGAWMVRIDSTQCVADIVRDNSVNVTDLLAVISAWGDCPGSCPPRCDADISPVSQSAIGDCAVNVSDLLEVISAWGNCPPPVGACCINDSCQQMTESACLAGNGVYIGNGTPCSNPTPCLNNDPCSGAINITNRINGAPVNGDNSAATPAFGGGDGELPQFSPTCHWDGNANAAYASVWYKFVVPANGKITLSLCNTAPQPFVDSIMALYTGSCGSLIELFCDEDSCTDGEYPYFSKIEATGLAPGATYYVAVMSTGGWNGSIPGPFVLNITSPR